MFAVEFRRMHFSVCSFSRPTQIPRVRHPPPLATENRRFPPPARHPADRQICVAPLKIESKINLKQTAAMTVRDQSRKCNRVMEHFNDEIIWKVR